MPMLETYGAQPPIELLRQWMDHRGWYDRKQIGTFKQLVDINFACAMGPPGGGRNPVTQRFTRHFNLLALAEMEDASKRKIFSTILGSWMGGLMSKKEPGSKSGTERKHLLPTPAKSHYTFNLRDLSKVFQGVLMAEASSVEDKVQLLRLWYHESCRVFQDRLVSPEDRDWFERLLQTCMEELGCGMEEVVPARPVLYGDFMIPGADNKIELSKNYGQPEWREDIKGIMLKAGLTNQQITFLFVDTQERILAAMKPVVQSLGQQPTKANLMAAYVKRVRSNIHTVLCMSPMGEVFRARLRQFPSLVTCCTIDWFSPWPREALQSVATSCLSELPELEANPTAMTALASMCVRIHQAVAEKCGQYRAELSRHNYVTPTSYLELLSVFSALIGRKRQELHGARQRMETGLHKVCPPCRTHGALSQHWRHPDGVSFVLLSTAEDVSKMQEELESMRPLLEEAARDTAATMQKIQVWGGLRLKMCFTLTVSSCDVNEDTVVAEETRTAVQAEEAKATEKARLAGDIAEDAQKDLDEALPAMDAALTSLKSLNKNDVTEVRNPRRLGYNPKCTQVFWVFLQVRAMQRPPAGVRLVVEAVCIMKGIKPNKVAGEKPGTRVDDYWGPGKALLQDPGKFLESLFKFDKPYIDNEEFQPASIAKVSKACTSICQWVRAMHVYHFVARAVEPKRQKLSEAQEDLDATQLILDDAKRKLTAVEDGIAALQAKYDECVAKRDELDAKCKLCEGRLVRADKLIGGLADEKVRWKETVQHLDYMVNNVAGDVLLSAAYVAYLGPFTLAMPLTKMPRNHSRQYWYMGSTLARSETQKKRIWVRTATGTYSCRVASMSRSVSSATVTLAWPGRRAACRPARGEEEESGVTWISAALTLEASSTLMSSWSSTGFPWEELRRDRIWSSMACSSCFMRALLTIRRFLSSSRSATVEQRIANINQHFTFSLYANVCRSLFEKHKLMFAFLLCARIMMNDHKIDMRAWWDIVALSALPSFSSLAGSFPTHTHGFRTIFDSSQPHREPLPGQLDSRLDQFQRLLVLRCLRPDRLTHGLQDFVSDQLGERFIETQTSDLSVVFKESSPTVPLIFGPWAEALMHSAMETGKWVFFQNCHLAPSWMPSLERLIENIQPDQVHRDFRLWLTSLPSNKFPVSILQNGSKMTVEPPRGIKANLLKTYLSLTPDFLSSCSKVSFHTFIQSASFTHKRKHHAGTPEFKSLLLSLCLFHGNAIERRKFGPLGFNIPYEFTDGDLRICISQLKMFLDENLEVPYKVLKYTAGQINYGGRVTDDWDRRCLLNVLEDFYCPADYLDYIRSLPINDTPEIFGLHDNANISFAQNETFALLGAVAQLQPRAAASGGKAQEEIVEEIVSGIVERIPKPIDVREVLSKYPVLYEESMNTVLAPRGHQAYPSLKPLASWVTDLLQRVGFLQAWISEGPPCVMPTPASDIRVRPERGCYVRGLYLEGARWDPGAGRLAPSRPKELHTEMAVIWMVPRADRMPPASGVYVCPIYKTLTRAGTLSTTGHSTNYVMAVELPSDRP
ncbi:hypothetical protein CRUP_020855, partial [Coryphaenoides rupestris]